MKIKMSEMRRIIKEELIKEANIGEISKVVDSFVRYLIGNRDIAINDLKKISRTFTVNFEKIGKPGSDEYNSSFVLLYNKFMKIIKDETQ